MDAYASTSEKAVPQSIRRYPPPVEPTARPSQPTFRHCSTCACAPLMIEGDHVAVVRPYRPATPRVVENGNRSPVTRQDAAVEEGVIVLDEDDWSTIEYQVRQTPDRRNTREGNSHSSSSGGTGSHGRRSSKRLRGRVYRYTDDHTSSEEEYAPSGSRSRRVEVASDEPSTSIASRVARSAHHYRPLTTLSSSDDESTMEYNPRF